jgi:hypothetical protein
MEIQEVSLNKAPQLTSKELIINPDFTTFTVTRVIHTISAICFCDNGKKACVQSAIPHILGMYGYCPRN